jgi:hypothetical protein
MMLETELSLDVPPIDDVLAEVRRENELLKLLAEGQRLRAELSQSAT